MYYYMEDLLHFITTNFWLILLILAMILTKSYRLTGMVLLSVQIIYGFIGWVYLIGIASILIVELIGGSKEKSERRNRNG